MLWVRAELSCGIFEEKGGIKLSNWGVGKKSILENAGLVLGTHLRCDIANVKGNLPTQ